MRRSIAKDMIKVGFGLTFGMKLGEFLFDVVIRSTRILMESYTIKKAEEGDEHSKDVCKKFGLKYEEEETVEESDKEE